MKAIDKRIRRALVTGASSGVGLAIARMLLEESVEVVGVGRSASRLPEGVTPLECDLTNRPSLQAFLERPDPEWRDVDLVVNCAGFAVFAEVQDQKSEALEEQAAALLVAPMQISRAILPRMRERGFGVIANISSLAALFPLPGMVPYSAFKAGLSQFSRGLQIECSGTGVHVLDIQLGDYRTNFNRSMQERSKSAVKGAMLDLWKRYEQLMQEGPPPEHAAGALRRALRKPRNRCLRVGGFFQAVVSPMGHRILPASILLSLTRRYYGLNTGKNARS